MGGRSRGDQGQNTMEIYVMIERERLNLVSDCFLSRGSYLFG